jgi:putative ABC transport system ATP-binding protein
VTAGGDEGSEQRLDDPAFIEDIVAEAFRSVSDPAASTSETGEPAPAATSADATPPVEPQPASAPPQPPPPSSATTSSPVRPPVPMPHPTPKAKAKVKVKVKAKATARATGARSPSAPTAVPPPLDDTLAARAVEATKIYGTGSTAVRAIDGVTVDFPRRRFTAIMGPSGSGKSTLMHCLAGLDTLSSGQVFVGTTDLGTLSEAKLTQLRRDHIGFVFQSFNLVPTLTAEENITLPGDLAARPVNREMLDEVVRTVGLGDRLHHRPSELSGGQQQRVAIARALMGRPDIVFADEPTGNLDSRAGNDVLAFMREAVDQLDQTIVMVTHDPLAASYADWVVFLADGHIVDAMIDPTGPSVLDKMKDLGD